MTKLKSSSQSTDYEKEIVETFTQNEDNTIVTSNFESSKIGKVKST